MKALFMILVSLASVLLSCKKDKEDIARITSNKIHGKWRIDSIVINQKFNGNTDRMSYPGHADDYIEFKEDGRMYTYFHGNTDNASYIVQDGSIIIIGGDSAYFQELTEHKLIIYNKAQAGAIGYTETIYYLKR